MTTFYDLASEFRVSVDGASGHVRGYAHTPSLEHFQQPRNSLLETILAPFAGHQIRQFILRCGKRALGLLIRFDLKRNRNRELAALRPEFAATSPRPVPAAGQSLAEAIQVPSCSPRRSGDFDRAI